MASLDERDVKRVRLGPGHALYLLSAGLILFSLVQPWWMDEAPLGLETQWPKATLAGSVVMVGTACLAVSGHGRRPGVLSLGPLVVLASLVAFYVQVVQNEFFPDAPFLPNVEFGFFAALLGVGWAVIAILWIAVPEQVASAVWIVLLVLAVAVVYVLYDWALEHKLSESPASDPIPEATAGIPPPSPGSSKSPSP